MPAIGVPTNRPRWQFWRPKFTRRWVPRATPAWKAVCTHPLATMEHDANLRLVNCCSDCGVILGYVTPRP